jgi:hypothetical protein
MLQTTTLKRNLVPRFEEARKVEGFGVLGGYHPEKKIPLGGILMLP